MSEHDPVNHPKHYTSHPSGVECNEIAEEYPGNLHAALHYIWRDGKKEGPELEDLRKAEWYLAREAARCRKRLTVGGHDELLRKVIDEEGDTLLGNVLAQFTQYAITDGSNSFYRSKIDAALARVREEIARRS